MRPNISFLFDTTAIKNQSSLPMLSQTRHKSGSCPERTIPIRKITRKELLRAASLEHFGLFLLQTQLLSLFFSFLERISTYGVGS